MGTGSSIFAESSGDESAPASSEDEPPSIFRKRDGDASDARGSQDDGEETEGGTGGEAATMTVFVDGERREFAVDED